MPTFIPFVEFPKGGITMTEVLFLCACYYVGITTAGETTLHEDDTVLSVRVA